MLLIKATPDFPVSGENALEVTASQQGLTDSDYPDRLDCELPSLDLSQLSRLDFETPDYEKFPCLKLAIDALDAGETLPTVLNAANEIAVQAFLDEQISFKEISEIIRTTMQNHKSNPVTTLEDVLSADRWTREEARKLISVAH